MNQLTAHQRSITASSYLKRREALILQLEANLLCNSATVDDFRNAIQALKADKSIIEHFCQQCGIVLFN